MKMTTKLRLKKYQNHLVIGIIVAAVLAGVVWAARPPEGSQTSQISAEDGRLSVDEDSYDFGTISMAAGKVSRMFKIRNASSDIVAMKKLYTSCMCTVATLKHDGQMHGPYGMPGHGIVPTFNEIMNPGEEADIEVTFDPAAHGPAGVGRISRVVYLETAGGQKLQLKFSATVTP